MRTPTAVLDLEISGKFTELNDIGDFAGALVLFRLHGRPLGWGAAPVTEGRLDRGALVRQLLEQHAWSCALPLAEKAVHLAPKLYAARNVLGRVLLELGQVDRSIKELEEGVKLAPSSPEMHFALARAYTRAGRRPEAARERETFKKLQDEYNQKRQLEGKPSP